MVFESYDEVFRFYKGYGHIKGFGVVVKRSWFRKGKCRRADLCCWKGGTGSTGQQTSVAKPTTKTNCLAKITARIWKDGLLFITDVVLEHNHLLSPSKARYIRCNRKLPVAVEKRSEWNEESGTCLRDRDGSFAVENFVHEKTVFFPKYDSDRKGILKLRDGDSILVCNYLLQKKRKDPNFFYLLDWDEEGYLRNVFWADAKSRMAYDCFGDVVTFDTTYLAKKYDTPFAPFFGVNNHGQSILFGCALLASETSENYVWFFEAWLSCMSGCFPKAIITDQCIAIQYAVSQVFPKSCHRFCLWQLMKKIPEKLGHLEQYKSIKKALRKLVYDTLKPSDFEDGWKGLIDEFGLERHKWLQELYDSRSSWAPVFIKSMFWAGMSSTHHNAYNSSFFDGYVHPKTPLQEFLIRYEMALQDNYEKEAFSDFESINGSCGFLTCFPMEEKLSKLYTLNMFKKFQDELRAISNCNISILKIDGTVTFFKIRECEFLPDGKGIAGFKDFEVSYNACGADVECVCQGFNFEGIVCRHALSVLKFCQEYNLPPRYILDRWHKDFKRLHALSRSRNNVVAANELERYDFLTKRSLQVIELAASSDSNFHLVMKLLDKIERNSLSL
ncbi:hypothetical protein HPP92_010131 [Vanilla planifolia]|uniref:Protein FAR1-RELATED SEQUENCE n=1 Tax=Vanilla planifolia TaxID=51239 RepID=A0A835UZE5_VANPL|nr:hypothetical protein HPP92_010131 [Vanilla planifolia]